MNTNYDIYKKTALINKARKAHKIWEHPLEEKYVLDNFYAFARGDFLVALTNSHNTVNVKVPNAPFANGTVVCNIFYPTTDCQTIQGGAIDVYLANGESKIYVPQSSQFFEDADSAQFLTA
jgi:alpha-amylase